MTKKPRRLTSRFHTVLALCGITAAAIMAYAGHPEIEELLINDTQRSISEPIQIDIENINHSIDQLKVAPESPMLGYSRDQFPHWERNNPEHGFAAKYDQYSRCTTRDVMLLRDAIGSVHLDPRTCLLSIGKDGGWLDQYGFIDRKTGTMRPYKWTTNSKEIDAEHIVALAEAWRSGAATLSTDTRRRIANDAINIVSSDPAANRSKGDQDPATYLPPGAFRCEYTARYILTKVKWPFRI